MAETLTHNQTFASPQDALAHYGVKGMKWGVVNEDDGTTSASGTRPVSLTRSENRADPDGPSRRDLVMKAALIAGGVAVAGGVAYGAHKYIGNQKTSSASKAAPEKKTIQEPTSVIYLARAKNKGLTFHAKGDTPDFFTVFDDMGLNGNVPNNYFSKDTVSGRVAARLLDPQGRKDFAGRPIAHDFVIPKNMTEGIDSIDDVRSKIWPTFESTYQKFWDENEAVKHSDSFDDTLAHYGVKGMKWGVRKDDRGAGIDPALTPLIATVAIYGGAAIVKARFDYVDSGRKHQKQINKQEKKSGVKHEWKQKESLKGPKTNEELMRDVVEQVNPGHPGVGTNMNCRRCTFAYEMRRRGNDVRATKSIGATGQDTSGLIQAAHPKKKFSEDQWGQTPIPTSYGLSTAQKANNIYNVLAQQPNGSRGEVAFGWTLGGGHSVAYEIVGGKPTIFCTQTKRMWPDAASFEKDLGGVLYDAAYTRLDNKPLDNEFLKRWIADVDEG